MPPAPLSTTVALRLCALLVSGIGSLIHSAFAAPGWTEVEHNGRAYITGDEIKTFYQFESYTVSANTLRFRSPQHEMHVASGTELLHINGVKFHLSYPALSKSGKHLISRTDVEKVIDPVLRPRHIGIARNFTTVVIDPGHGGIDTGTRSIYGGDESDYTLRLAKILKRELERKGFRVRMTRTGDTFPTLGGRVVFANRVPDSLFISLHFNHHRTRSPHGIETFALDPRGSPANKRGASPNGLSYAGNARDAENIALATAVHSTLLKKTRANDRGIKRERFAVLKGIDKPAILVEGGFLSNATEARKIASTSYLSLMAAGIADACVNFRNALRK